MITAETVLAARADAQPTGERYLELAMTGAVVASTTPMERRAVAAVLRGFLSRAPIATSPVHEPARAILGSLLLELESFAIRDAGDVVEPDPADLRDPAIVERERARVRQFADWTASERSRAAVAYHAHVDDLLYGPEAHQTAEDALVTAVASAEAFLAVPEPASAPAPAHETDDADLAWL